MGSRFDFRQLLLQVSYHWKKVVVGTFSIARLTRDLRQSLTDLEQRDKNSEKAAAIRCNYPELLNYRDSREHAKIRHTYHNCA